MKKYKVIERFTVDLISVVEAENEGQAQAKHHERIGKLSPENYVDLWSDGEGDSTYEIEEIKEE